MFADLKQHIASEYLPTDCMVSHEVGESEAPMLYYYTGILHQSQYYYETPPNCRWLLDLSKQVREPPPGMEIFWIGHRPDETEENLVLYKRSSVNYASNGDNGEPLWINSGFGCCCVTQ